MANTIKLKRGSGSDPGSSDLVVGEIAVRTDSGKLFTKKDDNSIAEISGGGINDGDKGDITVSSSGATWTIDSGATQVANKLPLAGGTLTGNLLFGDSVEARFGAGNDLKVYHASNISTILDSYGDLRIMGDTIRLQRQAGGENFFYATEGGKTSLYFDGSEKVQTSNTGATISGTCTATAFSGPLTGNVTGNTSGSAGSCTGNAATATTLATARTIGGTSFNGSADIDISYANLTNKLSVGDGGLTQNNFTNALKSKLDGIAASATNVTNNNQLTNGAGYITATLTTEQVQDIVGGMFSGNTETNISATYQDSDGTIDLSSTNTTYSVGDGGLTQNNFTNTLKSKLDGIESSATADQTASEILTLIKTVDGSGSGLDADLWDGDQKSTYLNQGVLTTSSPTFNNLYVNAWLRNNDSGEGLYNTANGQHWYSSSSQYWNMDNSGSSGGIIFRDNHQSTIRGYVYYNNSNQIGFLDSGGSWRLYVNTSSNVVSNNHFIPQSNNSYDLGTSSYRWRNLYVNDLQLSNEVRKDEGGNEVDGTWGDWTLQEGEENIFMINNRSKKRYKMSLVEVP